MFPQDGGHLMNMTEQRVGELIIREQVPLAAMTTLGVGGPARYFTRVRSDADVQNAVNWAAERCAPLLMFGRGSNVLVSDAGFPGLVIRMGMRGITARLDGDTVLVTAGAGETWDRLVGYAVARGWAGVECLAGIPGFVGATPVQNVGAYGQEVGESIAQVEAFDLDTRAMITIDSEDCRFAYRSSRFKEEDRGRYLILRVTYRLRVGGSPSLRYVELARTLAEEGITTPTLAEVRHAVIRIRRNKSMLLDQRDPNTRSVGSFFVNPMLSTAALADLEAALPTDTHIPTFAADANIVKVPAAWLIERVGFQRGYARGAVGLSERHTLALINRGGATARDVLTLAQEIRDRVRDTFGVTLVPEPAFIGLTWDPDPQPTWYRTPHDC